LSKEKIDDLVEKCASFIAKFLSKHLEWYKMFSI
jgi:hypothetical protein